MAKELGVCPATNEKRLNRVHHGRNAGRSCWAVAGTLCKGEKQGTYSAKVDSCTACDFYHLVKKEETTDFKMSGPLLRMLR